MLKELELVSQYVLQLEQIQSNIFNRDGPVATSLRSWALQTISTKTSEYLSMLNTKIHRCVAHALAGCRHTHDDWPPLSRDTQAHR